MHIATVKGKGFAPAEDGGLEGMEKWHAAKPKSIANGAPVTAKPAPSTARPPRRRSTRQVFGQAMVDEVRRDRRVVGITAAMNSGTGLNILQKSSPITTSTSASPSSRRSCSPRGLALEGVKPVGAIYSTFLQRAFDQIVHDVCLQKLNVVFAMDRAGLVGDDGPTHHGVFDIAYLRALPNMVLMAPRDEAMLAHMLRTALTYDDGPIALRYPRGEGVGVEVPPPAEPQAIEIGRGEILREGARVALIGYGSGVDKALEAADLLAEHDLDVDRRRRALRQADRPRADDAPGGRSRAARHRRGGRAGRRLRLGGVGDAQRRGSRASADPADRPARPLRHARQAGAAARGGGLHRQGDRRAHHAAVGAPRSAGTTA